MTSLYIRAAPHLALKIKIYASNYTVHLFDDVKLQNRADWKHSVDENGGEIARIV